MAGIDNPDGPPEVVVCAGAPRSQWQGDDAMAAQMAGCPICRRIVCHPDGSETEYQKKAH